MLATPLRPLFQRLFVDPVAVRLVRLPFCTAGRVTFLSFLCGAAAGPALLLRSRPLGLALLLISGYLDVLDGTVARLTGKATDHGAVLDATADRVVEVSILLSLLGLDPGRNATVMLSALGSIYVSMSTYLVISVFTRRRNEKGFAELPSLIERTEIFLFFFLMILLPRMLHPIGWIFTGLVLLTAAQRLAGFLAQPAQVRS